MFNFSSMFKHYVACALWSTCDDNDEPLDGTYDDTDFDALTLQSMYDDCRAFAEATESIRGVLSEEQMGHNFWLTRNGHGAGFWDRDYSNVDGCDEDTGDALTEACNPWGTCDLYVGDDGKIYC